MCRHQTLFYEDSIGYVVRCTACEHFQVGYGNVMLTLNRQDFISFHACIGKVLEMEQPGTEANTKSIFIPTPCEGLKLLLTKKELQYLNRMLDMADTEWKSLQLMDLFNHM